MPITRRTFLRTGALGATVTVFAPSLLARSITSQHTGHDRTLVVLQLAGGNDALNTFIPYTDTRYRAIRPVLAIPDNQIVKVSGSTGFHPALAPLVPLWESRRFAAVSSVGFGSLDRSHFHCQDVWQTGKELAGHHGEAEGSHGGMGWLGRWADLYAGHHGDPLACLAIGSRIPLGMDAGHRQTAVVADDEGSITTAYTGATADALTEAMRSIYARSEGDDPAATVRDRGAHLFSVLETVSLLPARESGLTYPQSPLGDAFELVARLLISGHPSRAIWITVGGFDTHSGQPNVHQNLLSGVAQSLAAFDAHLQAHNKADDVLVMAWSEFGRRAAENASSGTDHGKAGAVLLMGPRVRGGEIYGDVPDLSRLDNGDVPSTIDFRDVYWTIVRDFFEDDPEPVLGARYQSLGFIERPATIRRRAAGRG